MCRKTFSHRFRLYFGQRPEASAASDEAQQGNGRGDGRRRLGTLSRIPEAVLHGVSSFTQTRQSDIESVFADGGRQRARYRSRAGQSREEGSGQIATGSIRRGGGALCA